MLNHIRVRFSRLVAAALILFGVAVAGTASAQERPIKVVVVDLERVVLLSAAGKDLEARLAKFQEAVQTEGSAKAEAARGLRQKLTDGVNSLSEDKLSELQKQYEDATIAIKRFQDDKQREGQKMQVEGLRDIEKQLQPVFEKLRDDQGYDLILNNVPGVVVMANQRVDITSLVIERLNAAAAAGN